MTNAQLPRGVDAVIKLFNLCIDQYKHARKKECVGMTDKQRAEWQWKGREAWKWLDDMYDNDIIAAQCDELDKDTSNFVNDLQLQVAEAINPKERDTVAGPTLFDGLSEDAA